MNYGINTICDFHIVVPLAAALQCGEVTDAYKSRKKSAD
jgi:hypothetical protein